MIDLSKAVARLRGLPKKALIDTIHTCTDGDYRSTVGSVGKFVAPSSSEAVMEFENEGVVLQRDPDANGMDLRITGRIGSGGMGLVDSAEQLALDREVAVKRLRPSCRDEHHMEALYREAKLIARLEHPNIVPVHQLGTDEQGFPVMVMKHVRGKTWTTLIQTPNHSYYERITGSPLVWHLNILCQVCRAVEYAHSRDIIHRDIKSDNVMIGAFGEVYLMDWGIAVPLDKTGAYRDPNFAGTPCFAAPEMFDSRVPVTPLADVYLLGSLLHEILTLEPRHPAKEMNDILVQALYSKPYNYPDSIHPEIATIANRATAKNPMDRYKSVEAFRQAIERHLHHRHALDLLDSANELLREFTVALSQPKQDTHLLHRLGNQCRFAFEQAAQAGPDLPEAHAGVMDSIEQLVHFELKQGALEPARHLLKELKDYGAKPGRLAALGTMIDEARNKQERAGELATQIQYKLIERLQETHDSRSGSD